LRAGVLTGIDLDNVETFLTQRSRTARARRQTDVPFCRTSTKQNSDALE
jgi:hypothetical protein